MLMAEPLARLLFQSQNELLAGSLVRLLIGSRSLLFQPPSWLNGHRPLR